MRRKSYVEKLPDLSGVVVWLRQRGMRSRRVADLLNLTRSNVDAKINRSKSRTEVDEVATTLDHRAAQTEQAGFSGKLESSELELNTSRGFEKTEALVTDYSISFWQGVRFLNGTRELGKLMRRPSQPSQENLPLLRLDARLKHLQCETHLHAGYATRGLEFGLDAYGTWEYIFKQTRSKTDLHRLAKTILLISNCFISRKDYKRARRWLLVGKQAFDRIASQFDPEWLRQMASLERASGNIPAARTLLNEAGTALSDYKSELNAPPTEAGVRDMRDRVLYLIEDVPNWEKSCELLDFAFCAWPEYDSHLPSNVNYTAACGLMTDSHAVNLAALDLLEKHGKTSSGFGRQSTATFLLRLTLDIPKKYRRDWILFALSYNAYANK